MIIASHRRSGTHLLMKSLQLSFGKNLRLLKTHGLAGEVLGHTARMEVGISSSLELLETYDDQPMLYIVRDPRDTLTSNFHWWQTSGESKIGGIAAGFCGVTPKEWIDGAVRVERVSSPDPGCGVTQAHIDEGIFYDPLGFWMKHVSSYLSAKVPMVRYEDLTRQPRKTILRVAEIFGLKRPWWPRKPGKLVGHEPRKGIVGDYRNLLEAETVTKIEDRAGALMQQLGYLPASDLHTEKALM